MEEALGTLIAQQFFNGLVIASAYTLVAVGLTLLYAIVDLINFAHGEFYMAGAYILIFLLSHGIVGLPVLILLTIIIAFAIGALVERLAYRPLLFTDRSNFIVASLGLSLVFQETAHFLFGPVPIRPRIFELSIIRVGDLILDNYRILVLLIAIVTVVLLQLFIAKTKIGLAMKALSFDMTIPRLMGVKVSRIVNFTVALSFSIAALSGLLLAPLYSAEPHMGSYVVMKGFICIIVGGMGSVVGAIVGAFIVGLSETFTAAFIGTQYREIVMFIIVIIVLVFKPQGILHKE